MAEPKNKPNTTEEDEEIQHIVRIAETDLEGKSQVLYSLTGLKGINRRLAGIITASAGVNPTKKMGYITGEELSRLKKAVENIEKIVPTWMLNRRKDLLTGENKHIYGSDLPIVLIDDLNTMKKTRSYKGMRHENGLKVRGQRTKSTGRRGTTVGVSRRK